jgi:drug/metabolite transporter (DMT)-like permease
MYWWFILALLASTLWAVAVIVDKFVLTHYIKDAFSYQIFMAIPLIPPVLVLFSFASFHDYLAFYLIILVIGMFLGLSFVLYNKALLIEEVSRVTPLFYLTPLFVLLFSSLFLGERLSQNEYLGIGLLVFSAISVSFRKSELKYMALSPALLLILSLDLIIAGKDVIAKFMFSYIDFWSFLFWFMLGELIVRPLLLFSPAIRRKFITDIKPVPWGIYTLCFINCAIVCIGYVLYFDAVSLTYVALVSAIPSVQPFFVLLIAIMVSVFYPELLNESMERKGIIIKGIAVVTILVGTYLIVS